MRSSSAFTLLEVLAVIAVMAVLAVVLGPTVGALVTRGQQVTVNQQTVKVQEAINAWVAEQPTLAASAAQFQAGPGGDLVPADLTVFAGLINHYFMTDNDSVKVANGHLTTDAMTRAGCYIDVIWPQPYRQNYPHANLIRPN
ncbi:MAG: type II secretion system protein [Opitutaceae bacterium]|nr:type II secretion system protein [Opitutaceae bacterium]